MTDNEIIKALECCTQQAGCSGCPLVNSIQMKYRGGYACAEEMRKCALDLINRQKAEIERLEKKANTPFAKITFDRDELQEIVYEYVKNIEIDINLAKSEAIKEFAERLKCGVPQETGVIRCADVDNLVKEMTEVSE